MAHKSVINFGLAYTRQLRDRLYYAGSFRTDFNYFDNGELNRNEMFVPSMTYWDMYHFTSGLVIEGPRTHLSFGLNYGLGLTSGDPQQVSMSGISQENMLQGELNNNTKTQLHNIAFVFGLHYTINKMDGLKE